MADIDIPRGGVVLNQRQRDALSFWFSREADDVGEPVPLEDPIIIRVRDGQLQLQGAWLHADGEWGTAPECNHRHHEVVASCIPPWLRQRLEQLAEAEGVTIQQVVREALEERWGWRLG